MSRKKVDKGEDWGKSFRSGNDECKGSGMTPFLKMPLIYQKKIRPTPKTRSNS